MSNNHLGQPIGFALPNWPGAVHPSRTPIHGDFAIIEPLDPDRHVDDLHTAFAADPDGALWTYMFDGPFQSKRELSSWLSRACETDDPLFHVIVDRATGKAAGLAAYMRIKPEVGVIEIGHITLSPALQRTSAATEAMYLFMKRAFEELGYRRYEWKCDSLNSASQRAALRLGFEYDGTFKQAIVYKGRNRDTAWYSILDRDWPSLKCAYERWLDPRNFDNEGQQRERLPELIAQSQADR